ncbi:amidophosphoribosyltransferase [Halobacteriales archaeon SW_12_67_38]|nr:MAG: amidophosphoribosyltransferase [Halobacteriales archaeon SW_12_67_38]
MDEKCGVVGVSLADRAAARPLYYALYALQHRGQESAGIITHDGFQQHSHVEMGLVGDAFSEADIAELNGPNGIGHVRYPTAGSVDSSCAQPFSVSFKSGSLGLSHNGNLVNAAALRDELAGLGHAFTSDGAVMHDDRVLGLRDPQGNRPLCLGELAEGYVLASESAAIDALDGDLVRDVRPGELVVLEPDGAGYESHQLADPDHTARCFFEHVYFARPDSTIDGELVYEARRELGRQLWAESGIDSDVVMPVPDSGRAFASGYAEAANEGDGSVAFAEGLMKNRYVGRTFIMPTQDERERAVRLKLNPIKSTVENRTVTLIDDSIVRGTTSTQLVELLREAGAAEVHLRIGSPAIVAPCYMGIDMASREELLAAGRSTEDVCETIGADSLAYISRGAVADALDTPEDDLCMGCVTGEYPYDIAGEATDREVSRPSVGGRASADD